MKAPDSEPEDPRSSRTDAGSAKPKLAGARVLVVDDDPANMTLLRILLVDEGADVVAVSTPHEALAAVEQSEFDLFVFDIIMPAMRGDELLLTVRTLHPELAETPALAVTGYGSIENQARARTAGFRLTLYKPFDSTTFVRSANQLLAASA